MKTVILGIGNILLSDEGLGVRAVELIKARYDIPEELRVIDGGTMGLDLLPFIEGCGRLLLIDAVNAGKSAGTVVELEGQEVPEFLSIKMSVHQIGLPEMLTAARLIGILPDEICLVGMQPLSFETGDRLSGLVSDKMNSLLDAVRKRLLKWDIPLAEKTLAAI